MGRAAYGVRAGALAELGLDDARGPDGLRAEPAEPDEQYHVAYGAFTTAAQGVLAPDEDG